MTNPAVRCACPICKGYGAKNIGDAVEPYVQGQKVGDRVIGRVYRCLRCSAVYTVTPLDVFTPRQPVQPEQRMDGIQPPKPQRINPDLITSVDEMS